jgi:hypothetical protein
MSIYKFIKIKGPEGKFTGYYVPRLYQLTFYWRELKEVGFQFVKERLKGWTIWYVTSEEDYIRAVETLNELKKTRLFDFKVST